jgi:predicted DNA-binding protein (MmcQ/YjbR family)
VGKDEIELDYPADKLDEVIRVAEKWFAVGMTAQDEMRWRGILKADRERRKKTGLRRT